MTSEIETAVDDRVQQSELPDRKAPVSESEVETPVALSLIPGPEAPGTVPDARLVSHLANVELPDDHDQLAQADRAEVSEAVGNVPATYAEAVAALQAANAIVPTDKFMARVKEAKLERLRGHVHTLSQGPASPAVNPLAHFKRPPNPEALARINEFYPKPSKKKAAN